MVTASPSNGSRHLRDVFGRKDLPGSASAAPHGRNSPRRPVPRIGVWIRLQGSPVALITRHVRTMEADFESMLEQVVRQPTDYWGTPPLQTYSNAYKHNSFYTNQDNNRVSLGPFARRPRHLIIIVIGLVSIGFLDPPTENALKRISPLKIIIGFP